MSVFQKSIITALFITTIFSGAFSFAAAQSGELQGALENVSAGLEKVADTNNLSSLIADREARKAALIKIFDFSLIETADLRKKIVAASLNGNSQLALARTKILADLTAFTAHIETIKKQTAAETEIAHVQQTASEFRVWRDQTYNLGIKRGFTLLLLARGNSVLSVADARLASIVTDVKTLQARFQADASKLQGFLDVSSKEIREAHRVYLEAQDLFLDSFTSSNNSSDALLEIDPTGSHVASASIQSLVKESLGHISSAYKVFLEMSRLAKKLM